MLLCDNDLLQLDKLKEKTVEQYLILLDLKMKEKRKKTQEDGR